MACVPIGRIKECIRDGYMRVYEEYGTYKCPKIPENRTKIKGQKYWKIRFMWSEKSKR